MCGIIFLDEDRTAICGKCGDSELRLAVFLARRKLDGKEDLCLNSGKIAGIVAVD